MEPLSNLEAIERMAIAIVVGALVGFERERLDKPAGLRTYMPGCEGAALFMIGSPLLGGQVRAAGGTGYDPSRVASTVVQGIGFLGGGAIITSGARVRGLTTAAGIWVTAALGLLIGAGFYLVAGVATAVTLVALVALQRVETWFPSTDNDERGREELREEETSTEGG